LSGIRKAPAALVDYPMEFRPCFSIYGQNHRPSARPAIPTPRSPRVLAHVALNVLTNYFNVATDVEIDFPKVFYTEIA
jgi:hypothetical protein